MNPGPSTAPCRTCGAAIGERCRQVNIDGDATNVKAPGWHIWRYEDARTQARLDALQAALDAAIRLDFAISEIAVLDKRFSRYVQPITEIGRRQIAFRSAVAALESDMPRKSTLNLETPPAPGYVFIDVISGVEGPCLSIGDQSSGYRLSGPKPWGGGGVVHRFRVKISELEEQIAAYRRSHT